MTYEYLCTACGHVWEAEQSISAAPLKICPNCQKDTAKRQVSGGAGFILKGGGWYADLYGSAPQKPAADAKSDGAKDAGKTDAGAAKPDASAGSAGSKGADSGSSSSSSDSSGTAGTSSSGSSSGSKGAGTSSAA
jgi:putative FmdB family regulatory protein